MAISANTVLEVRTTGSDSNAGGFVTGAAGTDYSQQDAAQYTFTDLASTNGTGASPSVTSASHSFVSADVGNLIRITAGTSWTTGWFQIVSVAAGAATLDRACGSSATLSAGSYVVGGALLSPSIAASAATVAGNLTYIKSGSYTITTASTATAAGCCAVAAGTMVVGYSTTRTRSNTDTQPVITLSSVSAATIFAGTTAFIVNLSLDGASNTTSRGSTAANYRCKFANFTNSAASGGLSVACEASGCATATVFSGGAAFFCTAHGNSVASFFGTAAIACIAYGNTVTPFTMAANSAIACVAYGNTGAAVDGFAKTNSSPAQIINCIAESNGRFGINVTAGGGVLVIWNYSSFGNSSGDSLSTALNIGAISPSASVFTAAGSQDFSLNNTAGAGALLRGAGYASWMGISGSTVGYPDVGAVQHQDSGGGGAAGMLFIPGLDGV